MNKIPEVFPEVKPNGSDDRNQISSESLRLLRQKLAHDAAYFQDQIFEHRDQMSALRDRVEQLERLLRAGDVEPS